MTSFLIAIPDIQAKATNFKSYTNSTSEDPNEQEDYPFYNTFKGERWQWWRSGYTKSEHNGVYDLGPNNQQSASFFIISRIDYLAGLATTIDFKLQSSPDDTTYTDRASSASLNSLSLVGPYDNDHIAVFTETSAYRYWRAKFVKTAGPDFALTVGKIYFGNMLDLGAEPADYEINREQIQDAEFIADSGSKVPGRLDLPRYKISLVWEGLSDSAVQAFQQEVWAKRHDTPVFLYTATYHDVLNGIGLLHCRCTAASTYNPGDKDNWNTLEATFIEEIG